MSATDFEKRWGIPAQRVRPLVGDSTADLAVVARFGAGMLRAWPHARVWSPETLSLAAHVAAAGRDRTTTLPEAAFDWPIYQAARYQSTESCQSEGHRDPLYHEMSESELRLLDGNR